MKRIVLALLCLLLLALTVSCAASLDDTQPDTTEEAQPHTTGAVEAVSSESVSTSPFVSESDAPIVLTEPIGWDSLYDTMLQTAHEPLKQDSKEDPLPPGFTPPDYLPRASSGLNGRSVTITKKSEDTSCAIASYSQDSKQGLGYVTLILYQASRQNAVMLILETDISSADGFMEAVDHTLQGKVVSVTIICAPRFMSLAIVFEAAAANAAVTPSDTEALLVIDQADKKTVSTTKDAMSDAYKNALGVLNRVYTDFSLSKS